MQNSLQSPRRFRKITPGGVSRGHSVPMTAGGITLTESDSKHFLFHLKLNTLITIEIVEHRANRMNM
jgi:hypothetical protein